MSLICRQDLINPFLLPLPFLGLLTKKLALTLLPPPFPSPLLPLNASFPVSLSYETGEGIAKTFDKAFSFPCHYIRNAGKYHFWKCGESHPPLFPLTLVPLPFSHGCHTVTSFHRVKEYGRNRLFLTPPFCITPCYSLPPPPIRHGGEKKKKGQINSPPLPFSSFVPFFLHYPGSDLLASNIERGKRKKKRKRGEKSDWVAKGIRSQEKLAWFRGKSVSENN